jgi:spore germination cell wall hydrolase CwlJ-like protein
VTEHSVYPLVYYPATPFSQEYSMVSGQVIVLNLEFPGVPSSLLKVGRLRVAVDVNQYKKYAFTFYQIPFKPDTDTIDWN